MKLEDPAGSGFSYEEMTRRKLDRFQKKLQDMGTSEKKIKTLLGEYKDNLDRGKIKEPKID